MGESPQKSLQLQLSDRQTYQGLTYQVLQVELTASDRLIKPQDLSGLQLPVGIDTSGGVVISGRAPVWLFAYLTSILHPTAWVGCYDPRLGTVIVATNSRQVRVGEVISTRCSPHHKKNCKLLNYRSEENSYFYHKSLFCLIITVSSRFCL